MTSVTRERDPQLVDALVDLYVEWREECCAVQLAYERWHGASKDDRAGAFAAYNEALDREERASDLYAVLCAALIRQAMPLAPQFA